MNPRIFAKLIPRFKGASGAGSLLLNTKASQEAACSRAPAAIVPDQEPESHDAGVSLFSGNGSHLAATDAAKGHAGHADGSGSSGNAENDSHLAEADAAEGHAGLVDSPGSSGNARIGSHLAEVDAAEGHAGQVERSGVSGNAENGSHLEATEVSARWRKRHKKHRDPDRGHGANPKAKKASLLAEKLLHDMS